MYILSILGNRIFCDERRVCDVLSFLSRVEDFPKDSKIYKHIRSIQILENTSLFSQNKKTIQIHLENTGVIILSATEKTKMRIIYDSIFKNCNFKLKYKFLMY